MNTNWPAWELEEWRRKSVKSMQDSDKVLTRRRKYQNPGLLSSKKLRENGSVQLMLEEWRRISVKPMQKVLESCRM